MKILLAFGYFEINNSVLRVAVLAYAKLFGLLWVIPNPKFFANLIEVKTLKLRDYHSDYPPGMNHCDKLINHFFVCKI